MSFASPSSRWPIVPCDPERSAADGRLPRRDRPHQRDRRVARGGARASRARRRAPPRREWPPTQHRRGGSWPRPVLFGHRARRGEAPLLRGCRPGGRALRLGGGERSSVRRRRVARGGTTGAGVHARRSRRSGPAPRRAPHRADRRRHHLRGRAFDGRADLARDDQLSSQGRRRRRPPSVGSTTTKPSTRVQPRAWPSARTRPHRPR